MAYFQLRAVKLPGSNKNYIHPPKTNMTLEKQRFEDVFPIKHGDVALPCSFTGGYINKSMSLHLSKPITIHQPK